MKLKYETATVNLLMASAHTSAAEVVILKDGRPLAHPQASRDTISHQEHLGGGTVSAFPLNSCGRRLAGAVHSIKIPPL
jgi:hypothetical protein